jgi:hypothetical protein
MKPNYLRFQSRLEGYNCPVNRQIDSSITMPTGIKTEFFFMDSQFDLTLSDDSHLIKLYNQKTPACSGNAVRNSAKLILPINLIKMVLMIFIIKNIFRL